MTVLPRLVLATDYWLAVERRVPSMTSNGRMAGRPAHIPYGMQQTTGQPFGYPLKPVAGQREHFNAGRKETTIERKGGEPSRSTAMAGSISSSRWTPTVAKLIVGQIERLQRSQWKNGDVHQRIVAQLECQQISQLAKVLPTDRSNQVVTKHQNFQLWHHLQCSSRHAVQHIMFEVKQRQFVQSKYQTSMTKRGQLIVDEGRFLNSSYVGQWSGWYALQTRRRNAQRIDGGVNEDIFSPFVHKTILHYQLFYMEMAKYASHKRVAMRILHIFDVQQLYEAVFASKLP
ncbi:hypothetical protein D918_08447 [Trichuris suis]|nr:hypothetical protein D918_08447 [Trichuris suis]